MGNVQQLNLVASAARGANGDSGAIDIDAFADALFQLRVTAQSGTTPTLNVYIQSTVDGTNWFDVAAFTQVAAATPTRILPIRRAVATATTTATADLVITDATLTAGTVNTLPLGASVRIKWVLGGTTPNYTFSVDMVAQ